MPTIEIYTQDPCPYCNRAIRLLKAKGVTFEQYDVTSNDPKRVEMTERAGGRTTLPQIFIDGRHIGGCDDLTALEKAGQLDPLLSR